ncbi:hypothetical protein PT974_08032 [Cladobotryum mycophilum]|uniref:Acid phosphatase n=1 Tax=Cladobotryum mycophilum TaxID=491253 RepID=A0ABR0SC72_9HYPO
MLALLLAAAFAIPAASGFPACYGYDDCQQQVLRLNRPRLLTWTEGALRMNQIQVIGTHNSYHVEAPRKESDLQLMFSADAVDLEYSHLPLDSQLEHQHVRNLELDLLADDEGGEYAHPVIRRFAGLGGLEDVSLSDRGTKVLHIPDVDYHTVCSTLVSCLRIIKGWLDTHPQSVPIAMMMEFKTAEKLGQTLGGARVKPWDQGLMDSLDSEIRSVFPSEQLITPDDLRVQGKSLEQSILSQGWPDLESARGRIFFLMDNGPVHTARDAYTKGRPNLEGRVLFTNAAPGDADCAFQKLNDPSKEEDVLNIQKQVQAGYWVRTRADVPLKTVTNNCNTTMRDLALRSGAQVISTDFPSYGMSAKWGCDYAVRLPGDFDELEFEEAENSVVMSEEMEDSAARTAEEGYEDEVMPRFEGERDPLYQFDSSDPLFYYRPPTPFSPPGPSPLRTVSTLSVTPPTSPIDSPLFRHEETEQSTIVVETSDAWGSSSNDGDTSGSEGEENTLGSEREVTAPVKAPLVKDSSGQTLAGDAEKEVGQGRPSSNEDATFGNTQTREELMNIVEDLLTGELEKLLGSKRNGDDLPPEQEAELKRARLIKQHPLNEVASPLALRVMKAINTDFALKCSSHPKFPSNLSVDVKDDGSLDMTERIDLSEGDADADSKNPTGPCYRLLDDEYEGLIELLTEYEQKHCEWSKVLDVVDDGTTEYPRACDVLRALEKAYETAMEDRTRLESLADESDEAVMRENVEDWAPQTLCRMIGLEIPDGAPYSKWGRSLKTKNERIFTAYLDAKLAKDMIVEKEDVAGRKNYLNKARALLEVVKYSTASMDSMQASIYDLSNLEIDEGGTSYEAHRTLKIAQ